MSEELENKKSNKLSPLLILNIIVVIGLIVIYILYFTNKEKPQEHQQAQFIPAVNSGSNSIVFVNSDLILEKYDLVKKLTDQLERDRKKKDTDFSAKQKADEEDAAYFQMQVEKQAISEQSAQQIYEQLMMKQQELYGLQEQYSGELAQKEFEMNIVLLDSIRNYLNRLNKIYRFDYVLSYNTVGNILLAKDTFDITQQVLDGLNKEYFEKYPPQE